MTKIIMKTKNIFQKEAISFGWKTTTENFLFFFGMLLIIFLISIGTSSLEEIFRKNAVYFIIFALSVFVNLMIQAGTIKISLDFADGKKSSLKELTAYVNLTGKLFIASLIYGLIIIGGFILLIVPGVIWGIKYSYYAYFIIEKNASPLEALRMSANLTNGAKSQLFILEIVLCLINLLGMLCLFIGLFFTVPLTLIAKAYVYRKLGAQTTKAEIEKDIVEPTPTPGA
jgi:uncharacterized membrane protein